MMTSLKSLGNRLKSFSRPRLGRKPVVTSKLRRGGLALGFGALLSGCQSSSGKQTDNYDVPLRNLAWYSHKRIGVAVHEPLLTLPKENGVRDLIRTEFDSVTPENSLKMKDVSSEEGRLDFYMADRLVEFAQDNNMVVRGHTLVFAQDAEVPQWLKDKVERGEWGQNEVRDWYVNYINEVVSHYRTSIYSWDVVNEAYDETGRLRQNFWTKYVGQDYVKLAFEAAHQANPTAQLYYNDYHLVAVGSDHKLKGVLAQLTQLKGAGVPVHGIGLQGHMTLGHANDLDDVRRRLQLIEAAGFKFQFTEVDVAISRDPRWADLLDRQADQFSVLMQACLEFTTCESYTIWGSTDSNWWGERLGNRRGARATLFDDHNQFKPAYLGVQAALLDGYLKSQQD